MKSAEHATALDTLQGSADEDWQLRIFRSSDAARYVRPTAVAGIVITE